MTVKELIYCVLFIPVPSLVYIAFAVPYYRIQDWLIERRHREYERLYPETETVPRIREAWTRPHVPHRILYRVR